MDKKLLAFSTVFYVLAIVMLGMTFITKLQGGTIRACMYASIGTDICLGSVFLAMGTKDKAKEDKTC